MHAHEDVLLRKLEAGQERLILRNESVTVSRFWLIQLYTSPTNR